MEFKLTQKMVLAALALSGSAFAQTKAPEPDYTLSYNVGAVTDYRFRGISQTRHKPALQGGVDFAHASGFYLGLWASTIRILKDIPGGKGSIEVDLYGGYKGKISDTFNYDVGVLRYQYPRENFPITVNTTELYGAVTYGPATVKYSHSVGSQTFGVANSRGTYYLEAAATFDLGSGYALTPHIGHQRYHGSTDGVAHHSFASYTDYSLGLSKDLGNGFAL